MARNLDLRCWSCGAALPVKRGGCPTEARYCGRNDQRRRYDLGIPAGWSVRKYAERAACKTLDDVLRFHVTGAIERGEGTAIVEIPAREVRP